MRILHVNKFLYRKGGAEAYMLDVADLQTAEGHDVELFGMAHPENPRLPYEDWFPRCVTLDPPPPGFGARVATASRMVWSTSTARGIRAVIEDFRPDVAHLHNVYHQLSPSIVATLASRGVPTVMTVHDYKLVCPSYQLLAGGSVCDRCVGGGVHNAVLHRCMDGSRAASAVVAIESGVHRALNAYRGVGLFIAPSRFLGRQLERDARHAGRVVVVPHPARPHDEPGGSGPGSEDPDGPSVRTDAVSGGGPFVLCAGRLSPEKGVDVAIDAVARVPGLRLVVAGDGPEHDALEQRAATVAPDQVVMLGRVDRAGVAALMEEAVAVVVPSRWHENQPMTVLEAFGAGTPVVSTDLGGLPELVDHGRTGLVVPVDDVASTADALASLLRDPGFRDRLGLQAKAFAREVHDPLRHLQALDALYDRVAGAGTRGTGTG